MNKPLKNVVAYVADWAEQTMEEVAWSDKFESPIEKTLFGALYVITQVKGGEFGINAGSRTLVPYDRTKVDMAILRNDAGKEALNVAVQHQIGPYRVDMLVTAFNSVDERWHDLVVECDGHDFHERTKDQAARDRTRDRELQALGYTVYRFTGSEIYNDPVRCVVQILTWVMKNHWAEVFREGPR